LSGSRLVAITRTEGLVRTSVSAIFGAA
jgi:hypothetical protein